MNAQQVREAAQAFYDRLSGDFHEEYGISREDALDGMIAALQAIGMLTPQQVGGIRFGIKRLELKAEHERQRKEEERRAALTPEEREREDDSAKAFRTSFQMQTRLLDRVYASSQLLGILKSPNADAKPYSSSE